MSNSSVWPIDRTLSGATTQGQSGPGSNGNESVLRISESSSISGASLSDCLMSYPGHSLVGGLRLCRDAVGVFYNLSRLGSHCWENIVCVVLFPTSLFAKTINVPFIVRAGLFVERDSPLTWLLTMLSILPTT